MQTVEMNVGSGQLENFVEVICIESPGQAALDIVINEIVQALEANASIGVVRLVQNVLAKWRHFWSGVAQGLLTREQQLGVFGELWFLTHWLGPSVGMPTAVRMWRGPIARNDFELPGLGIEVKTTGKVDATHTVHGIEQLLEPPGGALLLFGIAVRDESSGDQSLPSVVQTARQNLAGNFSALAQFDSTLYAAGYEDQHASEYSKLVLRVRSEELLRVSAGFPRLVPNSILGGVPPGVGAVNYELRLDSAHAWRVATSPLQAASFLSELVTQVS